MRLHPADRCGPELIRELNAAFLLGTHRTPEQDVEYAIDQLVEIAVRALSPGVNDPFTAMNCIDWLGVSLARLARLKLPSRYRYDDAGELRVIVPTSTFQGLTDAAFNQIRQNARGQVAVSLRMLEVMKQLIEQTRDEEHGRVLLSHALMVHQGATSVFQERDRQDLEQRYQAVLRIARTQVPSPGGA